jgi:hypothetical protein
MRLQSLAFGLDYQGLPRQRLLVAHDSSRWH